MVEVAFFETNVLVYADDAGSPARQQLAAALFVEHRSNHAAVVSLQVLQEYFAVATRKLRLPTDVVQRKVEIFSRARVVCFQASDIVAAIELHRLRHISFWDALIIHAARVAGCGVLYSEDLPAGASIGGVRIVNPFAATRTSPSPKPRRKPN
jgi:predicted nucleic acid-binding protein